MAGRCPGPTFLKIGVNVRATAMGNGYTVAAPGSTVLYRIPAGLIQGKGQAVFIHHLLWLFVGGSEFLELPSATRSGGWGVYAHSIFVDGIEVRTAATPEPLAETNALWFAIGRGYAWCINKRLMVSAAGKDPSQKC